MDVMDALKVSALCKSFGRREAVRGVSSLGLHTTVHPAASAGATFQDNKYSGRFHGVISAATPAGS